MQNKQTHNLHHIFITYCHIFHFAIKAAETGVCKLMNNSAEELLSWLNLHPAFLQLYLMLLSSVTFIVYLSSKRKSSFFLHFKAGTQLSLGGEVKEWIHDTFNRQEHHTQNFDCALRYAFPHNPKPLEENNWSITKESDV